MQIGFTFLVPAHPGSPGKRAVKLVCVCVLHSHVSRLATPMWEFLVHERELFSSYICPFCVPAYLYLWSACEYAFSALTLLDGRQEQHPACKN